MKVVSFEDICSMYLGYTLLSKTDSCIELANPNGEGSWEVSIDHSITAYINQQLKGHPSVLVIKLKKSDTTNYTAYYFSYENSEQLIGIECFFLKGVNALNISFVSFSSYVNKGKVVYYCTGTYSRFTAKEESIATLFYEKLKEVPEYRLFFVTGLWKSLL